MKFRVLPRWLAGDVIAFIGVLTTLLSSQRAFAAAYARLEREDRRWLKPEEFSLLASLLALAETYLAYAIARRAFRLAGLKRGRVRMIEPTVAASNTALMARAAAYLRGVCSMTERAEAMAVRIRALASDNPPPALPLRLAASRRSSTLRVDPTSRFATEGGDAVNKRQRTPPPPERRGRWIAAAWPRDGGGKPQARSLARDWRNTRSRAGHRVRAPPWLQPKSAKPRLAAPASEGAAVCAHVTRRIYPLQTASIAPRLRREPVLPRSRCCPD